MIDKPCLHRIALATATFQGSHKMRNWCKTLHAEARSHLSSSSTRHTPSLSNSPSSGSFEVNRHTYTSVSFLSHQARSARDYLYFWADIETDIVIFFSFFNYIYWNVQGHVKCLVLLLMVRHLACLQSKRLIHFSTIQNDCICCRGASTGDDLNEISKFYPGSTFSGSELFFLCIAVSVAALSRWC